MRSWIIAALGLVVAFGSACTPFKEAPASDASADTDPDGLKKLKNADVPVSHAPPATTTTSTPTLPAPPETKECSAATTQPACVMCCEGKRPDGQRERETIDKAWLACVCARNRCGSACGPDFCASTDGSVPPAPACVDCMSERTETCEADRQDAWTAFAMRTDVDDCLNASACSTKPQTKD